MTKRKRLSDEELKSYVADRLRNAAGGEDSQVAKDRLRNLEAYLAEPIGEWAAPDIEDRSALVATDVADTVEWMLPSLLRIFATSKDAIDATPRRPQFEAQAATVKATLRWLMWEQMDGVTLLHNWFKDGLISKVGFVKVSYESNTYVTTERYAGLTEQQVEMLATDADVEIVSRTPSQQMVEGQPVTLFDVELTRSQPDGKCVADVVPPEEMRVDSAARYGDEPRFIGQEYRRAKSSLQALGYDVEGVQSSDSLTDEALRRLGTQRSSWGDDDDKDPLLECVEAYVRLGGDAGDAWEKVLIVGDQIVVREDVDQHPYVWWCPAPMPHVFFGHCPADWALEPQRLRTQLIRAVVDNVYLTVNGRTGVVEGQANIDDLLDSRPGGIVRLKSPDALVPVVQPDLTQSAWSTVEWAQQWTEHRTGFSRLSKGLNSEALNETATGVLEITERADMRVELIARHAAAALAKMLHKMLRCLAKYQDVAQSVRINGQWVDVDPREWSQHYQITVKVGLGSGARDRTSQALGMLQQIQAQMVGAGMIPPPASVLLVRSLAESMGIEHPERYFPDPGPPQPPQPPIELLIEQSKQQAHAQEVQMQAQAKRQEVQANLELQAANDQRDGQREMMKAELDARLQESEQQNKRYIAEMQAANDRYRAELEAQTKLQIAGMQQQANVPDTSGIDATVQQLGAAVQQMLSMATAPRRVVRDPATGKAMGVEIVAGEAPSGPIDIGSLQQLIAAASSPRRVVRDPAGRVVGAEIVNQQRTQ